MTTSVRARYTGYRFPAEIIGHAVWLYFRLPLGLRMVEELLAERGIIVSHEAVRQWARKLGQQFANQIRRRLPRVAENGTSMRWFGHRPDLPFCHKKRETMILMRSAGATLALALLAALSPFVGSNAAANQCTQAIPGKFLRSYNMVIR